MRGQRQRPNLSSQSTPWRLLGRALASVANAILITDHEGRIVWVNEAFSRLSGYSSKEAIGQTPSFLKSGKQDATFYRELWQTILAGNVWRGEVIERRKDGSFFTVDEVITPLRDDAGAITHFIAIQHDITQRKREGEREHYLAYHDVLTGLPNRALFLEVLQQSINSAKRAQQQLALLFVDLDNFKPINDSRGHHIGDRLLVAVAERLGAAVRKTDTVARLGGDEFAILQTGLGNTEVATALARKLLQAASQPFVLEGQKVYTTISIGIAIYPADGEQPADLLRNADQAMYRAKEHGRNAYELYAQIAPLMGYLEQGLNTTGSPRPRGSSPTKVRGS